MTEHVILVDENDNEIGTEEKIQAHKDAKLHRAFSIYVYNPKGQLLLQKRAAKKYHCRSLWSNTCCGHPRKSETVEQAVHRRLKEEMGFECELTKKFQFIYKSPFKNGLTEHEFLHVFTGTYNEDPKINPEEADDFRWINMDELKQDIQNNPENYTPWFRMTINRLES